MKIVVAPDKFKGTMTAAEVCRCIEKGIEGVVKNRSCGMSAKPEIVSIPLADGGEGSLDSLVGDGGMMRTVHTFDAHGRRIKSRYGVMADGETAVIEAAESIGLSRLGRMERNPAMTSSYGFGAVIRAAIGDGYREFVLAIGGSATNDCGTGMLAALGAKFYDVKGGLIDFPAGSSMGRIAEMEIAQLNNILAGCRFTVACDVSNTLLGELGAVRVYSAQKGADQKCMDMLEEGAESFSLFAAGVLGKDLSGEPYTGAAGGLGWALAMFCGAGLVSGSRFIAEKLGFADSLNGAELVVTGEGKIDTQTSHGKVMEYVCTEATRRGVPVIAYCGTKSDDVDRNFMDALGLSELVVLTDYAPLEQALKESSESLIATVEKSFVSVYARAAQGK